MSKKNKKKPFMSEWSDGFLLDPSDLLDPLQKLLIEGYKLERKNHSSFDYVGFNIGEAEQLYYPTPAERFSGRWLNNEAKFGRTLLNNTLMTAFQLGMEFSRRLEMQKRLPASMLEDILKKKVEENRKLRLELSEYDAKYNELEMPNESDNEDLIIENFEDLDEVSHVDVADTKEED